MHSFIKELEPYNSIALGGHIRPDGDCIGSCLGLYLYLKKIYPTKRIELYLEDGQSYFQDLTGYSEILHNIEGQAAPEAMVVLDCNPERLGFSFPFYEKASCKLNIDHHISNTAKGKYVMVDPNASSTSEMVFRLIEDELLDEAIAKALYIGMVHDTGVFQYSNTSPETMRAAARLMEFSLPFTDIIESTFYEKSYHQTQIMGRALLESFLFLNGKCAVAMVDKKTMEFYQVGSKDLDGIVNQLKFIKGVECAIFLYETGLMEYKVSLRAGNQINVSKIAEVFGGGGHIKAAGCTMNGTFHDVISSLAKEIEKQL